MSSCPSCLLALRDALMREVTVNQMRVAAAVLRLVRDLSDHCAYLHLSYNSSPSNTSIGHVDKIRLEHQKVGVLLIPGLKRILSNV